MFEQERDALNVMNWKVVNRIGKNLEGSDNYERIWSMRIDFQNSLCKTVQI